MAQPSTYTDVYGPVVDTGAARSGAPTINKVWIEQHRTGETDTGSKLTVSAGTTVSTTGIPHFHNWQHEASPR